MAVPAGVPRAGRAVPRARSALCRLEPLPLPRGVPPPQKRDPPLRPAGVAGAQPGHRCAQVTPGLWSPVWEPGAAGSHGNEHRGDLLKSALRAVWVNPSCHDLGAKTCPIITTSNPYLLGLAYLPRLLPLEFSPSPRAVTLQRQSPRAARTSCQLAEAGPEGFLSQRDSVCGV